MNMSGKLGPHVGYNDIQRVR